jgi:amino acid permease
MLGFGCLTLFSNLDLVFKYAPFAMGALVISTMVLLISFPFNIDNIDKDAIAPKPFSFSNLLLVASINSFAFTCHPSISPMLK